MSLILFLCCLMIIEPILSNYISFFSYLDEIITIFMLFSYILKSTNSLRNTGRVSYKSIIFLLSYLCFIFFGLIGNYIYGFQSSKIAIFKDILAISKFIICYLYAKSCTKFLSDNSLNIGMSFLRFLTLIMFICLLIHFIPSVNIFTTGEYRYNIKVYRFLFSHPTFMVASCVAMTALFLHFGKKSDYIFIFLLQLIILSGMRTKGIVIFSVLIAIILLKKLNKIFDRKSFKVISFITVLMVLITILLMIDSKINETFKYGLLAARPALYIVSGRLFVDCFPLGSGFGSFASSISGEYYSNVYSFYGIQNVIGLTSDKYNYMADTYWPYILGQFGLIGTIIYLYILFIIFKYFIQNIKDKNYTVLYILAYILFTSVVETIFTNVTIILMGLILILMTVNSCNLKNFQEDNLKVYTDE